MKKVKTYNIWIFNEIRYNQILYVDLASYGGITTGKHPLSNDSFDIEKLPKYIFFDDNLEEYLTKLPLTIREHGTINDGLLISDERHILDANYNELEEYTNKYTNKELKKIRKIIYNFENQSHINIKAQEPNIVRKRSKNN